MVLYGSSLIPSVMPMYLENVCPVRSKVTPINLDADDKTVYHGCWYRVHLKLVQLSMSHLGGTLYGIVIKHTEWLIWHIT